MTRGRAGYAESQRRLNEHHVIREKELEMIYYTCMLLFIGLIAAFLGLAGVAEVAVQIAGVLFVTEMVLELAIHLAGRRTGQVL